MASYSNTTLSPLTIDKKWDMDLLEARYAASVMLAHVLNKSDKVSKSGEVVSIQIKPKYTTGTVAAGGGFTPLATAPTQANITVNTWAYVAVEIDKQAEAQSFWDPTNEFPTNAGKALSVDYDVALLALHSSVTGAQVGDPNTPAGFDDGSARTAILRLANANIITQDSVEDLSFVLTPGAWLTGWLSKLELTAAYATGLQKSLQISGSKTPIMGIPAFQSTCIATVSGVRKCLLLHKQAMGIAMQRDHEYKLVDRAAANVLGKVAVVDSLYGTAIVRADHAVVINVPDN